MVTLVYTQDATTSPGAFVNRTQLCFAVRGGVDSLLDAARAAFCDTTAHIQDLAATYASDAALGSSIKARTHMLRLHTKEHSIIDTRLLTLD